MFCTFSLQNVTFRHTAWQFFDIWTSKSAPGLQFCNIFTSKCAFRHSGVQFFDIWTSKSAPGPQFFNIFTSECAFRHSGVQFFDIWTSKSGPGQFFNIFTSECAFRHSGVQFFDIWTSKSSRTVSFLTFSLPNVLFATAACNFSTSELQKVLPDPQFLYIFTSKCAFRHSGVQFFDMNFKKLTLSFCTFSLQNVLFATAACNFWFLRLSSDLRTRRFNRPTFRLTRHTNHWKNTAFRDFSNIWRGCIFFLLTFALLHLLSADLTTLLCFSTVHIVGSFYLNFLYSNIIYHTSTMSFTHFTL